MSEVTAVSTHGTITFDSETGRVLDNELDPDFGAFPTWFDVFEWKRRYPGENIEGSHDILDFGYLFKKPAEEIPGHPSRAYHYEPPCEEWREDREKLRKDEL
jgi:hypothetical protein